MSLGHEQTGKVFNLGQFMAMRDAHGDHTVYVKRELAAPGKPLELAMRDGATLSIGVTHEGVRVHEVAPRHEPAHELGRTRAVTQAKGHGLER